MNKLILKAGLLVALSLQIACADDSDKSAEQVLAPATGISESTGTAETAELVKKAADNLEAAASKDAPTDEAANDVAKAEMATDAVDMEALQARIAEQLPGMPIESIAATPITGVYELVTEGQIYYINDDANFLLTGNMIELATQQNLTELRLGGLHMDLLAAVDEKDLLIYEPEEKSDRSITVFTDISCGYCRLLHEQIDTLLDAGVAVRYMMFPRAGMGSPGHQALESVWCADDPLAAMTTAKAGGQVAEKSCDNPIESHVQIAEQVGLRGTPLIYLDTGERVHGYRSGDSGENG